MRKVRALWLRLRETLRGGPIDQDFATEMKSHLEMHIEDNLRSGMSREEARRQALLKLGGLEQTIQAHRDRQVLPWLEALWHDLRYGLRMLRKAPVFTLVVAATLALGIGATTAVFSVVDRILFRALPYAHADRIVSIGVVHSLEREEFTLGSFFFDWRDRQKPFAAFASQGAGPHTCDLIESNPVQLACIRMQAGFLPLLGVRPVLGRNFLPEEDRPHGPPVALISYSLWHSRFNGDPAILNRLVDLDGNPVRIVGVLPANFELPTLQTADVFRPLALDEGKERNSRVGAPMRTFARLKPGVTVAQATAEMEPLFFHTEQTLVPTALRKDVHLSVRSLRDRETENVQLAAWVLLGAVFAVLLIACANVAALMMARTAAREHELAIRSALGASRARLVCQTLTEAFLLSFAGATAGIALATGLVRIFVALAPTGIPFLGKAHLDLRIAIFTILVSLACGAVFGLMPGLEKPRSTARAARSARYNKQNALRRGLVVAQIAISMVLLSGAALLLRSFVSMEDQPLGIQTRGVLSAAFALPEFRFDTGQKTMQFYLRAEDAIRKLPGVGAVAWTDSLPPGGWRDSRRFSAFVVAGTPRRNAELEGTVVCRRITPDFFRVLDIPIFRGRNFTDADRNSQQSAVILSRLLAARLFPGTDPVGQHIRLTPDGSWQKVIGIADDAKNNGLTEPDDPEIYFLRRNVPEDWSGAVPMPRLIFESVLPPRVVVPLVRSRIAQLDPTVPVKFETLNEHVSKLADRPRFETALLGFFAFAGLVLAVIGLYGVIAFMTTQRTREIGVRVAVGASRIDILRLILKEGLRLTAIGGTAGLIAALALARVMRTLLFQVGPYDPASFIAVTLLLAVVAVAATLIPARAAMRVEPVAALRHE